jgi:hypothetical protein
VTTEKRDYTGVMGGRETDGSGKVTKAKRKGNKTIGDENDV